MSLSIEQTATAISRHDFDAADPYLLEDVTWIVQADVDLTGQQEVREALAQSTAWFTSVTTTFERFIVRVTGDSVVVESTASYVDASGVTSIVASCDIYGFVSGMLSRITSYNIELPGGV